ncbi:hypothetical protein EW146_g3129 [Bondarzewia mesenterica]|uniref:tripeptidyl-peptidase II n=1 Tax=Bondarzewia mesenterica TaxID=1095465 RepID=A0A4S4LYM5_9AGAM|nr:hypothetical protein EW146_g3129 [Bondarzewia mesenterica]
MLVLSLFLLAGLAQAAPHSSIKVKERVPEPRNWVRLSEAPADHTIALRIALPQPNFRALEMHLYEVSDPAHARYGAHLSKEEVEALVRPHEESVDAVNDWLASHGIQESQCHRSPAKDWVKVDVPVGLAENMLDAKYHVWQHVDGDTLVRTTSYSLPEHLHRHIDLVQPTTMFGRFKKHRSTISIFEPDQPASTVTADLTNAAGVDATCNTSITIKCLQQIYNIGDYVSNATNGNQIGLTGYLEQFANIADLNQFYTAQRPQAVNSNFTTILINGGQNDQNISEAGIEANLDTQFAFGLTFPTPGTFYSTGGSPPFIPDENTPTDTNEPYIDVRGTLFVVFGLIVNSGVQWLAFVLNQTDLPQSISTSYGDDEQTVPQSYAERACQEFAQLGARGVSLMFSSGDSGVGDGDSDPATQTCITNDGTNTTQFIPSFPASCPYVTAVGGTQHFPEVAVSRFFSGGGFSNYFARPAYQEAAVSGYLSTLPEGLYAGLFNQPTPTSPRKATFFLVVFQGATGHVGGTSASSPTFAGVVALLNDARINAGLPPLGFLNPLLYSTGVAGLNDITVGNNAGCGTEGFNASTGWDPVTGLGTPNFGKLKDIVLDV